MVKVKAKNKANPVRPVKTPPNIQKNKSRYGLWFVALVSILFFLSALSYFFLQAEVTVNPKIKAVALSENLSASKDSDVDGLSFNLVVIGGEENKIIQANGQKDVATKATGTVMVYNALSSTPQALSVDTRLVGSNGKIYKTQSKTVVPGIGKNGIPGSVEVKIYASVAGAEYNSAPLDFTILGFKGTPKYSKIYARSKGDIKGGFVGKAPAVSAADQASAISDLKNALGAKLLQKAMDQIPKGFVLFKSATFLNTDSLNNQPDVSSAYNPDNSVTLTLKGTLDGILLDEQKLTKKIAADNIDKYDGSDVYIPNIRDLTFTLSNKDNASFADVKNINFNLKGAAKIVWRVDANSLRANLLGKSKKDFSQVLLEYPNIDSADLVVNPFWRMSLPDKSKDIKVIVNYPN